MLFTGSGNSDISGSGVVGRSSEGGVTGGLDEVDAEEVLPLALSGGLVCSGAAVGFCSADVAGFWETVPAVFGRPAEDGFSAASEDAVEEASPVLEASGFSDDSPSLWLVSIEDVPDTVSAPSGCEEETAASGVFPD